MNDETEDAKDAESKPAQPTDPVRAPKPRKADLTRVINSLAQRALFAQIVGYLLLGLFCVVLGVAAFYSLASLSNNAAREQLARDIEGLRTDLTNTWQTSRDELSNRSLLIGDPDQTASLIRDLEARRFSGYGPFDSLPRREREAYRNGTLDWLVPSLETAPFEAGYPNIFSLPESRGFFVYGQGGAGLALRDRTDWISIDPELAESVESYIELAPGLIVALGSDIPLFRVSVEAEGLEDISPELPGDAIVPGWQNAFALEGSGEFAFVADGYLALAQPNLETFRIFNVSLPFVPDRGLVVPLGETVFLLRQDSFQADNRVVRVRIGLPEPNTEMVAMPPLNDEVHLDDIVHLADGNRTVVFDLNSSTAISIRNHYGADIAAAATLDDYARAVRSLPAWTRNEAPFAAYYSELERFERLDALYARQFRELNAEGLDGRTSSMLQFLKECRGFNRESTLLEACIDGYRTATGDTQLDLYRDLSERAGGIILLLFFLTAVGSLYRYNLKLVSFYKAREDMLQMAKSSLVAGELDAASLTALGQTLAAEHIEFKATQSPTGEIADIVKSLRGV